METIYLRRTPLGLAPNDELAAAALAKVKVGESVKCDLVRPRDPRSAKQNRLYWRLMQVVFDNTDGQFRDRQHVSEYLKIQAGHCDYSVIRIPNRDGTDGFEEIPWAQPRSIAFDKMGHTEFQDYWKKALQIICERIIPMSPADLEAEVFELLGEAA